MVINSQEKSCKCPNKRIASNREQAQLILVITAAEQNKKACSITFIWYYIKNQVIEEIASFNLLPSKDIKGLTFMWEYQNISQLVM
jgi:hypothetical protein